MAFNVETVGTLGSGADHSASTGALAAWELSNQSAGGQQRAVLITSFEDDVNFSGWPSGEIEIVSDVVGAQRTITPPSGGDHCLKFSDANITTVKIEDIICDGTGQATSQSGIYVHTGVTELTLNRCRTSNCEEHGLHVGSSALLETLTANNCIFNDNDVHGALLQYVATASTNTFTNCLAFDNGADGWNSTNNSNITRVFQNCIAMDNDSSDFETQVSTTTTLDSCVSSDTSAEDSGTDTNCAVSKTTYADYFLDHTAGNFTRTQNDSDGFGKTGNASLTPDRDYHYVERVNDTIGPFDYILGRQTHRKSLEFAGGYADLGSTLFAGLTAWTVAGWVKWNALTSNTSPFFGNAATYDCAPTIRIHTDYTTSASIKCIAGNGSGANIVNMYTSGDTVFVNVWHHLAFSYDGTNAVLYVDGVAQTVTEASSTLASQALHSSDTLRIGGGQSGSSAAFPGHQLDARVYDRAITAAEASDLADNTKTTSTALDTLAHYKLESGHPTICFDSSGNGEHGTLSGSVKTDVESPVPFSFSNEVGYSSSLKFDGNVVYPAIADHLTFPAAIKTTMSVANDWSLHIDYIAGETTGILFGTTDGTSTDRFALGNGTRCSVKDSTGQINASVSGSAVSGNRDRWVVTWEASGRNLKTWRDGVANSGLLDANMPGSSGTWAMASAGGSLFDSGDLIKIQVFSTNLSDAEALALSQGTAATTAPYASYDFEDGVGLVVADSEGSAHATVVKDPIWVVVPRDESDQTKDVRGDELSFPISAVSSSELTRGLANRLITGRIK